MTITKQVLSHGDVARLLNVSLMTIHNRIKDGSLPEPMRSSGGRSLGFRKSDIEKYLNITL